MLPFLRCYATWPLLRAVGGRVTLVRLVFVLALLGLTAGCGRSDTPVLSAGERYASAPDLLSEYRLGVGDRIRVTVFREPDVSGEFTVAADGTIAMPLIGAVKAKDRLVAEVAAEATARLADGYLREPRVAMEIAAYRPFFILGEVGTPGSYPYVVGLTIENAVATAAGYTPRADRDVVRIRRQGQSEEERYRITPELRIYPGDTIRIGERFF